MGCGSVVAITGKCIICLVNEREVKNWCQECKDAWQQYKANARLTSMHGYVGNDPMIYFKRQRREDMKMRRGQVS